VASQKCGGQAFRGYVPITGQENPAGCVVQQVGILIGGNNAQARFDAPCGGKISDQVIAAFLLSSGEKRTADDDEQVGQG